MRPRPPIPFLGLHFDPLTLEEAADAIVARAREQAPFAYVTTPNVDHIVRIEHAPKLRDLYDKAWLNLCDSRVLEALARVDKLELPAAPGADLVALLLRQRIDPHETIAVVGGTAETIRALRARFALADIRWHDAPRGLRSNPEARAACVEFLAHNPASYVFLALGSPQQEMVAREAELSGRCIGVALCCGASLDFLSGEQKRAPEWMREARLEWLHRLGSEPGRMGRRYLVEGPGILGVWMRWRKGRGKA